MPDAVITAGIEPMLACFELDGQSYGIDVVQVREIVRSQPVIPLPSAPELVEGVIELRDEVVPVVDLGMALGNAGVAREDGQILVVRSGELVFGLRVDAVTEVVGVELADIGRPPELARDAGQHAVRAVVRRRGANPVMVLSLENLLRKVTGDTTRATGADGREKEGA